MPPAGPGQNSELETRPDDPGQATVTHRAPRSNEPSLEGLLAVEERLPQTTAEDDAGRFSVIREHARGGLGQIYVARDRQLGREVALKEIQPVLADDLPSRKRFVLEAEVTGNLEHPGFVPVYALGRHADGRPYYAMRLIRGDSLKDAITKLHAAQPSPRKHAFQRELRPLLRRLVDVCNAMAYAHSRGVIHRDLKPANILLGPYGETVVVDWGLAKILRRPTADEHAAMQPRSQTVDAAAVASPSTRDAALSSTQTDAWPRPRPAPHPLESTNPMEPSAAPASPQGAQQTLLDDGAHPWPPSSGSGEGHTLPGRAVGTPAYMSPEQAAGALELLGPATDVYSLGATLYCLLTGRPPFGETGDVHTVLIQVQSGAVLAPRNIAPHVPRPLEAICLKALARKPEDRHASMTELADDLECFLDDEPVAAYREPLAARIARWTRRHKAWALALFATVFAILTILGISAEGFRRSAMRERTAREHGLRVAAKFAARTVAAEIDRRWRILEDEVDQPDFIALVRAAAGKPVESPERLALQAWLTRHFETHQSFAAAANWFLTDAEGTQVARAPLIEKSIGVNYAYRDYFNGLGHDLAEGTRGVAPLDRPHRSIVFRSRNTGRYMVVFSVPVRDSPSTEPATRSKVLGVIGMSVDIGRFGVLQLEVGDSQLAVLAELRPDETGRRGLVLHHPKLLMSSQPMVYLPARRVSLLERLRSEALARARRARPLNQDVQDATRRTRPLPNSFTADYVDPQGAFGSSRWLAAFEPVIIQGRPDMIDDTGWVVIVQERAEVVPNED